MIAYEKKIAANKALTDAIAGATQALIGLSNTTRLTEDQFNDFEKSAASAYDKLIDQGFTEKEALQQLAPMLARLKFLHEQYGLTLDDATQKLLDQADAQGVNTEQSMTQEEAFSRMTGALEQLVKIFGGDMPNAIDLTTGAFKRLNDESDKFNPDTGTPEIPNPEPLKPKPDFGAAGGFYSSRLSSDALIQAHRGERVEITPVAQNSIGGRNTNITITLVGSVTPEIAADAIKTAYINNTRGLKSLLEN